MLVDNMVTLFLFCIGTTNSLPKSLGATEHEISSIIGGDGEIISNDTEIVVLPEGLNNPPSKKRH
jgi:hypothetical protein